jgi:hypothetical protein
VIARLDADTLIEALRDRKPAAGTTAMYVMNRTSDVTLYVTSDAAMTLSKLTTKISSLIDTNNMAHLVISDKFKIRKDDSVLRKLTSNPICASLINNAQVTGDAEYYVFGARLIDLLTFALRVEIGPKAKDIRSNILSESLDKLPGEDEESKIDSEANRIVDETLVKVPLTGEHAQEIIASLKKQASEFKKTTREIFKADVAGQQPIKQVVWVNDVNLQPSANLTPAERAGRAAVNKYFSGSLLEVRGKGMTLYDAAHGVIAGLIAEGKVEGRDFVVVTSVGDATLSKIAGTSDLSPETLQNNVKIKELGKLLNIKVDEQHLVSMIGLCDVILRMAYELGDESILRCLNSIAWNGQPGSQFTPADLRRGILTMFPKMGPVNLSEIAEAYKAMEKVLQAL